MKVYLLVMTLVFGLVVAAHVARVIAEGPQVARDPWFVSLTALAAFLCIWSLRLFLRSRPR